MIERVLRASNASKALVALLLNVAIDFSEAFEFYDFSEAQEKALEGAVNGVLIVYLLLTFKLSAKRSPEPPG